MQIPCLSQIAVLHNFFLFFFLENRFLPTFEKLKGYDRLQLKG